MRWSIFAALVMLVVLVGLQFLDGSNNIERQSYGWPFVAETEPSGWHFSEPYEIGWGYPLGYIVNYTIAITFSLCFFVALEIRRRDRRTAGQFGISTLLWASTIMLIMMTLTTNEWFLLESVVQILPVYARFDHWGPKRPNPFFLAAIWLGGVSTVFVAGYAMIQSARVLFRRGNHD